MYDRSLFGTAGALTGSQYTWTRELKENYCVQTDSEVLCTSSYYKKSNYRYGYQGQFAEKDDETGWSHFELREYDPVIGRWLVPDPYGQYWSAYMAMGNNPVNMIDPDGAYSKGGAWWRNIWNGGLGIYENEDGVWGYDTYWRDENGDIGGINAHFGRDDTGTALRDILKNFESTMYLLEPTTSETEDISTSIYWETMFVSSVAGGKAIVNYTNKEIATQHLINNMLRKDLSMRTVHTETIKLPKSIKFVGKFGGYGFTAFNLYSTNSEYRAGKIGRNRMLVEQTSNVIGSIPYMGIGLGWSLGWNLGKKYGPSKWYGSDNTKWFK